MDALKLDQTGFELAFESGQGGGRHGADIPKTEHFRYLRRYPAPLPVDEVADFEHFPGDEHLIRYQFSDSKGVVVRDLSRLVPEGRREVETEE